MPPTASRFALLAGCCLSGSCALSTNARQSTEQSSQASNPLVGGASMAMTGLRMTALATVKEPLTTTKLGLTLLWNRPQEMISANLPFNLPETPRSKEIPGTPEFEKLLDRKHFPMAQKGSVKWLVDGRHFFPEFERHIATATKSINVQVFIFDNDDAATKIADELKGRSKDVKVHVLFDDMGSTGAQLTPPDTPAPEGFVAPDNIATYMEDGSKVKTRRTLNPWLVVDHTKLMLFDQQCAMLGGMNIGREYYSEWHDLMGCIEGPIVTTLQKDFNRTWHRAGPWGDFATLFHAPDFLKRNRAAPDDISIRPLRTDPADGRYEIMDAYLLAIRSARTRIWIENPYIADDRLIRAICGAARRGVDVRVVVPAKCDTPLMDVANVSTERELIQAGAKVYRYPRMTHMKVMLCDGWGTMGSANLDMLSMRINRELNIAFHNPGAMADLEKQVFLPDFKTAKRVALKDTDSPIAPLAAKLAEQL